MEPWEVMTSESQERMLAIVTPESWPAVAAICAKWEVRATVIGTVTEPEPDGGGRLRIRDGVDGPVLADVPAASLSDDAPLYDRPRRRRLRATAAPPAPPTDCAGDLLALLRSPGWVYRQYDHQLFLNTVAGPGADAALLRLAGPGLPPSQRGVALTTDSNPRACALDPRARHGAGAGRGRGQPGLRRGDAGGGRQLPELREPRAPRGDVAALGVHRRHGRGLPRPRSRSSAATSASTTRAAAPTSTPRRCSACSAWSKRCTPARRDWPGRPATPSCCSARARPRRTTSRWKGRAGPPSGATIAPGGSRRSTSPRTRRCARSSPRWWQHTWPEPTMRHSCTPCTTCRAAAWPSRWPKWRPRPASVARWTPSLTPPSSSRSCRRASWWPRATPDDLCARAAALGVPTTVLGRAGGERVTLGALLDLPVAALSEAHEGNLALALGEP